MSRRRNEYCRIALIIALIMTAALTVGRAARAQGMAENPKVIFSTTLGNFVIELYPDMAPITVKNFLAYVNAGFFDNTIFHRVIPGFMIQGGGFTEQMQKKTNESPHQERGQERP